MATTATPAPPANAAPTSDEQHVTFDRVDYVVGTNKQGEPEVVNGSAKNLEERIKSGDFTEVFRQTVAFPIAATIEGVKKIASSPEIVVRCFNAGAKQKALTRVLNELKDMDENKKFTFEPIDGSYDLTELVNAAPQRQVLSQREKLERDLKKSGLPEAVVNQMLAVFDSQNQQ